LKELIEAVENLQKRHINLVSLTEHIDTTTATDILFLQFIAMFAELNAISLVSIQDRPGSCTHMRKLWGSASSEPH
jgi:hypothetical protein